MTDNPSLSVVTTTDPSAKQLPFLLEALSDLAKNQKDNYEVIIVDDLGQWGSSPTPDTKNYPGLHIKPLYPKQQEGQLRAILLGLQQAQAPLILTIDPDLHSCVPEIPNIMKMITPYTLAVHGIRCIRPDTSHFRILSSAIINQLVRLITRLNIDDIGSPITLFDRQVLEMLPLNKKKQRNIRIQVYMGLGDKLRCYNLRGHTAPNTPSHYSLPRLILLSWRLLRDCMHIKAALMRSRHSL